MKKILTILNVVLISVVSIVMLFLILGGGVLLLADRLYQIAIAGYLMMLIFGMLAFSRQYLIFLSLVGWAIFGVSVIMANNIDVKNTENNNKSACLNLRKDKNCVEDIKGSMTCKSGNNAGVFPRICEGVDRR